MILKDKDDREVEVEFDRNQDGSRFIKSGVYVETGEPAPDEVLDWLQDAYLIG